MNLSTITPKVTMSTNTLYQDNVSHMAPVWTRIFNFVADRAEGSYIYTDDGRKLLDFTCGIGVTNTGHCHPKIVEAIREQAGLFTGALLECLAEQASWPPEMERLVRSAARLSMGSAFATAAPNSAERSRA